jgi:hypothetical protein
MFGAQHQISIKAPVGCAAMQLALPALEQSIVDGVADQRVREQEHVAARLLGPHEKARYQGLGGIIRSIEQVGQSSAAEPLAENRGGLNGGLVHRGEPIDARLHEALHRAGNGGGLALVGVSEELVEKKRVAGGPLDAALGESRVRRDEHLGESARVVRG